MVTKMSENSNQQSPEKWWFWMRNSGFGGSAPFLTLEIHRINALTGAEYEKMFGTTIGTYHQWIDGTSTKYFRTKDVNAFGESFLEQLVHNPNAVIEWQRETDKRGIALIDAADSMGAAKLDTLSIQDLSALFNEVTDAYWRLGVHSSIPLFGGRALQNILEPELYTRISELGLNPNDFGTYYTALTSGNYLSWPQKEELALRLLAQEIKAKGLDIRNLPAEYSKRITAHAIEFEWIPYKWIGPVWKLEDFIGRIEQMVVTESKSPTMNMTRDDAAKTLRLEPERLALYIALAEMGDLKEKKGNYMSRGAYQLGKFRQEIIRRFGLTERMTALMLSDDYNRLLREGEIDKETITDRQTAFLWHAEEGDEHFYTGMEALRKIAEEFAWKEAAKTKTVYEGTPVFPGKAVGLAKKILRYETDHSKFRKGDILISYRTTPHYVPLMDMASAVITSEGGLTQHAAQIAREHQIPCVVGVRDIIEGVEDGQPLLVEANRGRIEKILKTEYEKFHNDTSSMKAVSNYIARRELTRIRGPDILWIEEASHKEPDRNLLGNKAANQSLLYRIFNVPNGFIVTTAFYYQFVEESGLARHLRALPDLIERAQLDSTQLHSISRDYTAMIVQANVNGYFDKVQQAYHILDAQSAVTRSSGIDEDSRITNGRGSSFAGIFETYLNHRTADQVVDGIKKCWASLFSPRALLYSVKSGFDPSSNQMGVLVQEMKNGNISGVMYTGVEEEFTMIEACEGLCDPLVAGRITPALYMLDKNLELAYAKPGSQRAAEYVGSDGTYRERPVTSQMPLSGKELFELGMIGRKIQNRFGTPQDIEWTIAELVYVVQNRDLTAMPLLPTGVKK